MARVVPARGPPPRPRPGARARSGFEQGGARILRGEYRQAAAAACWCDGAQRSFVPSGRVFHRYVRCSRQRLARFWRQRMKRTLSAVVLALGVFLAAPGVVNAQVGYFGQNKVQYRTFKFQVMKTTHFDVYYYPEEENAARMAGRMAERWYARFSTLLKHELRNRQPLILYGSGSQFRQTNVVEGDLGEGTGGVTEAYKRRIALPFAGPIQSTDHVLGHELVHAFQYDITNTNVSSGGGGALNLPLWFIEGMAEYFSLGPVDPQ